MRAALKALKISAAAASNRRVRSQRLGRDGHSPDELPQGVKLAGSLVGVPALIFHCARGVGARYAVVLSATSASLPSRNASRISGSIPNTLSAGLLPTFPASVTMTAEGVARIRYASTAS